MKKLLIVMLVVVLIVATAATVLFLGNEEETDAPETIPAITEETSDAPEQSGNEATNAQHTITYSDSGFNPETLTVAAGESITIRNNSSNDLDFASDDHPTHLDNSELNAGMIAPGSSRNFSISEEGTWGYHNHLNDNHSGEIIVE